MTADSILIRGSSFRSSRNLSRSASAINGPVTEYYHKKKEVTWYQPKPGIAYRFGALPITQGGQTYGHLAYLEKLERQARTNGADVRPLSATAAQALEPRLRCIAALHSPSTGIIDSHALMRNNFV